MNATTCNQTALLHPSLFPVPRNVRVVASASEVTDVLAGMLDDESAIVRNYAACEVTGDGDDFRWIVESYSVERVSELMQSLVTAVEEAYGISERARVWDRSTVRRMRFALEDAAETIGMARKFASTP